VKALLVILTIILVVMNAFFVMAEYALVRSRRTKLETMAAEGLRGARLALHQVEHIGDYISACQVGITLASIAIGAVGEPAIAHILEPLLGPALGHTASIAIAVIIAYVLITFAQTIFGEMVPKLYVIQHAEGVLRRIARPLQLFRVLFHPFIVLLTWSSNRLLRSIGTDPDAEPEAGTPEELKRLIAQSTTGG